MTARIVLQFDTDLWRAAWRELIARRSDWQSAVNDLAPHSASAPQRHLLPTDWVAQELSQMEFAASVAQGDAIAIRQQIARDPFALELPTSWWSALHLTAPWEALLLRAPVLFVKEIEPGTPVSYGFRWRAQRPSTVATIGVGYGDGYRRAFSDTGVMGIGGRGVPVIGRVCMDQTLVDVTDLAPPGSGSDAVSPGSMVDVLGGRRTSPRAGADRSLAGGGASPCDFLSAGRRIGMTVAELVHGLAPRVERLKQGGPELQSASLPSGTRAAPDVP